MNQLAAFSFAFAQVADVEGNKSAGLTVTLGLVSNRLIRDAKGAMGMRMDPADTVSFFGQVPVARALAMEILEACDKAEKVFGTGRIVVPPPGSLNGDALRLQQ